MKNRLAVGIAAMFMALVCSPRMFAAITEELILNDGVGDVDTIQVAGGIATCSPPGPNCTGLTVEYSGGDHGQINAIGALGQFGINATAKGGGVSILPTLQDLNQLNATSTGAGTLTSTFTDFGYTDLNPTLEIADSKTNDKGIKTSTIDFAVMTDASTIYTNTLTGESDDNGLVDVANPNYPNASVTSQTVMTFKGTGDIQANITVANAVPEPASIVFLGTMLLGLTALIRNRRLKRS